MEYNTNDKKNVINKVYKNSIAHEMGIEIGDLLISINNQLIHDIIEYKYLMSEEYLEVLVQQKDGELSLFEIEKEYDEDLGIEFSNPIIDVARSCTNKCIFCFVDQLPNGMRETLYFKDDDSRLSFLQGNFVTLTNMSKKDIDNIIKYRISPINISVHTTNPNLRETMISNKFAGDIYRIMQRLAQAKITMNCQIVLCTGINDGKELERTVDDLVELYPHVNSVAVVPVGVTKYRRNLVKLRVFDKKSASETVKQVHKIQNRCLKKTGTRFVFLSDEFYVLSAIGLPSFDDYEGFLQFEDGVGMIRKIETEIKEYISTLPEDILKVEKKISIATGELAYDFMNSMAIEIMNKFKNIDINVYKIVNNFFGRTITVSGLITAGDLIEQLRDKYLGEALYITRSMLKSDEEIFLDNISLEEIQNTMNIRVVPCLNDGKDFIDKITGIKKEKVNESK